VETILILDDDAAILECIAYVLRFEYYPITVFCFAFICRSPKCFRQGRSPCFFISAVTAPSSQPTIHLVSYGWYVDFTPRNDNAIGDPACELFEWTNARTHVGVSAPGIGLSQLSPSHSASSSP
jgi:hypothetical protein